jgi:protein TonB
VPSPSRQTPATGAAPTSVAAVSAAAEASADTRPLHAAEPALTPAGFDADYLNNRAPLYPSLSRRTGGQGKVVLRMSVSTQVGAEHIEFKTSSGSQGLADAAGYTLHQ